MGPVCSNCALDSLGIEILVRILVFVPVSPNQMNIRVAHIVRILVYSYIRILVLIFQRYYRLQSLILC